MALTVSHRPGLTLLTPTLLTPRLLGSAKATATLKLVSALMLSAVALILLMPLFAP